MQLVINDTYGGISLSSEAMVLLGKKYPYDVPERYDEKFIECVLRLGDKAGGWFAHMRVVEIPDNITDYKIYDYDGREYVVYVLDGKIKEVW